MLTALLLAACPLVARVQEKPPTEAQIASTCETLAKALAKDAKVDEASLALHAAMVIVDARVIEVIDTKGLRHDDPLVRDAAVEALARMEHPAALKALHDALKRDRRE